jgi:hypothetical protein
LVSDLFSHCFLRDFLDWIGMDGFILLVDYGVDAKLVMWMLWT